MCCTWHNRLVGLDTHAYVFTYFRRNSKYKRKLTWRIHSQHIHKKRLDDATALTFTARRLPTPPERKSTTASDMSFELYRMVSLISNGFDSPVLWNTGILPIVRLRGPGQHGPFLNDSLSFYDFSPMDDIDSFKS